MPQKTKKEKIIAEQRRKQEIHLSENTPKYSFDIKTPQIDTGKQKSTLNMELHHIRKDLLKISSFTLIAIVFQFALHFFIIK